MLAGIVVLAAVLAAATALGLERTRRDGRLRRAREQRLTAAQLGQPLGQQATLLQFSSSFCAPCRAARTVLAEVAAGAEGVAHVELDVADRVDLVRLLDVRRTPTFFVLGPRGQVVSRGSGVPRRAEVTGALGLPTGVAAPAPAPSVPSPAVPSSREPWPALAEAGENATGQIGSDTGHGDA